MSSVDQSPIDQLVYEGYAGGRIPANLAKTGFLADAMQAMVSGKCELADALFKQRRMQLSAAEYEAVNFTMTMLDGAQVEANKRDAKDEAKLREELGERYRAFEAYALSVKLDEPRKEHPRVNS